MRRLCDVAIRSPLQDEFAYLTDLRNSARHRFGDQRALDGEAAAAWLASRTEDDCLLCIQLSGVVVGSIGWTRLAVPERAYEVGRIVADYRAVRRGGGDGGQLRRSIRIAYLLSLDHLFDSLGADSVCNRTRKENGLVRNALAEIGMPRVASAGPDDGAGRFEDWRCTHRQWPDLRARILAVLGMPPDTETLACRR